MINNIVEFLRKYHLEDKTIVVGFSGGYDSMCLLDILSKIKDNVFPNMRVIAAHFNHNWRGEESFKEQEICRLFALSKDFDFYTKTASFDIKKTENDARIARYEFFEEVVDEYDADAVFTAHNKDDNAETVLYRVIKGTGLVGLKGISQKRDIYYRPLLKTSRADIVHYCEVNNLNPNNDSSNTNIAYKRNYLRLNVIPTLERINPTVKDSLNTLAEVATSENAIIEEYLAQYRDKLFDEDRINSAQYRTLSEPVKKRFIHEYIQSFNLEYDFKKINEVYEFIEANIVKRNGSTLSLASALWLYVDEKIIETIPRRKNNSALFENKEISVSGEGEYHFGNKKLTLKKYVEKEVFVFPDSTSNFVYVDLSKIQFPLVLRTRKDGDIINPFGMSGTMKLKKYLNSKGISKHNRDDVLLLTNENEVLWVVGVGLSEKIGVSKVPTHVIEVVND
jgi:tRNA(Ile)-lysidine synthase